MPSIGEQDAAAVVTSESGHSLLLDDRCLLPEKIIAVRNDNGTWSFKVNPDFSALIREVGVLDQAAAMSAILQEVKVTRTRGRRGARTGPGTA
jgi:hypothetical protein